MLEMFHSRPMYYCGYAKNIFTLFISDAIVCTHPQSNRLLLLPSSVMATLVNSSAVLLFPYSKSFLPVPYLDLHPPPHLLHCSQRPEWSDFSFNDLKDNNLSFCLLGLSLLLSVSVGLWPNPNWVLPPSQAPLHQRIMCRTYAPTCADAAADQNPLQPKPADVKWSRK